MASFVRSGVEWNQFCSGPDFVNSIRKDTASTALTISNPTRAGISKPHLKMWPIPLSVPCIAEVSFSLPRVTKLLFNSGPAY